MTAGPCADKNCALSVEGDLLRAWRQQQGLTLSALGQNCRPEVPQQRISEIETDKHRPTIPTLLRLIHGLSVPGRDDAARLARFFQGPDRQDAEDAFDRALEDLQAARRPRAGKKAR